MRFVFAFVAATCCWLGAFAQDLPIPGRGAQRIEQYKKIRMIDELKMDEETSIRFFVRYNKYQDALREITAKRDGLIDQLAALRKSEAASGEFDKVLKDLNAIEMKIVEERGKFIQDLKEVLSTKQIADYVIFERNFNRHLRELMREMTQERRGRGGSQPR